MSSKSIFAALSFSVGCLALSGAVQAAPVTFSDSTSFLNAVSVPGATVGTDTFDAFNHGGNLGTTSLNRNAGGIAYTVSSSISTLWAGATSDGFLTTDNMTSVMSISNFSLGITSFGLNVFGSNFDSFPVTGQSMRVLVTDVMNNVFDYLLEGTTLNTYFGFIGEYELASIAVSRAGSLWPSMDNLTLASAGTPSNSVPTPMTLALIGVALLGVAATRRRND